MEKLARHGLCAVLVLLLFLWSAVTEENTSLSEQVIQRSNHGFEHDKLDHASHPNDIRSNNDIQIDALLLVNGHHIDMDTVTPTERLHDSSETNADESMKADGNLEIKGRYSGRYENIREKRFDRSQGDGCFSGDTCESPYDDYGSSHSGGQSKKKDLSQSTGHPGHLGQPRHPGHSGHPGHPMHPDHPGHPTYPAYPNK